MLRLLHEVSAFNKRRRTPSKSPVEGYERALEAELLYIFIKAYEIAFNAAFKCYARALSGWPR